MDQTTWIDQLPCAWHRRMVRRALDVLPTFPGVRSVVISGSLASPSADRFSDLDLMCVVDDTEIDWWVSRWPEGVEAVAGPLVVAQPIGGPVVGGFSLTPQWEHVDLIVRSAESFVPPAHVQVLYDPRGIVGPTSADEPSEQTSMYFPHDVVTLFIYLLGTSTVTLGRGEILLAHGGVVALRDQLVKVMLAENGIRKSDGQKRLNPYLTKEQQGTLLALPVAEMTPPSIIAAYHAIAQDLVGRAQSLAVKTGDQFPDALLAATEAHLAREMGPWWTDLGPLPTPKGADSHT